MSITNCEDIISEKVSKFFTENKLANVKIEIRRYVKINGHHPLRPEHYQSGNKR